MGVLPAPGASQEVSFTFYNVWDFGAVSDGVHDDAPAINAAITASQPGSTIWFPGNHLVGSVIQLLPNRTYLSVIGYLNGFTFQQKNGSNLPAVLAASDWYNNAATSGYPIRISNVLVDANKANNTTSDGIVLMNFNSVIEDCSVINAPQNGIRFTGTNRGGSNISNTAVENRIRNCKINNCGNNGIYMQDAALNAVTDWFIRDCIISSCNKHIQGDNAAGALIEGCHTYGSVIDSIILGNCYGTRVIGNYVDGYGSGSSSFIAGIGMGLSSSNRQSLCIGNTINFDTGAASGVYQAFRVTGPSSGSTQFCMMGNTVQGGGQGGSLGYVLQATSSHAWSLYFWGNRVTNAQSGNGYFVDGNTTVLDDLTFNHIGSLGSAAAAAAGANAGTSPPAPVLTRATDLSGTCTFGTGTTPSAGAQVIVTFAKAYANAPSVVITPNNSATAALNLYVTLAAGSFTVNTVNAPAASQANTTYSFTYHVFD